MNVLKEKILKAISHVAEKEGKRTLNNGAPICIGYIYQPKRPKHNQLIE